MKPMPMALVAMLRIAGILAMSAVHGMTFGSSSALAEDAAAADDALARHVMNRLAFGPTAEDLSEIRRSGVDGWIDQQLHPETIPEARDVTEKLEPLETTRLDAAELFKRYGLAQLQAAATKDPEAVKAARQRARVIVLEAAQARLIRAIGSRRQLQEVMVDFWFNHFNVFAGKGLDHLWVGNYEDTAIRPHALGRFRDLLEATARHPAMLFYLDNWQNAAPGSPEAHGKETGLNENYARELMELHTLGVDGGYTQNDVIALARILTGWGIVRPRQEARRELHAGAIRGGQIRTREIRADGSLFAFDPNRHDFGDKIFLGHTIRGQGAPEVEQALDILAKSPAAARHLSFELAQYFVADQPPQALVDRLTRSWIATDGDIGSVLKTLFASPEFRDPANFGAKFKTPYQYVVSSIRAADMPVGNFRPLLGTMLRLGQPLYGCQTPDGYKNTREAWLNPDGMTLRLSFATGLGSGRLPIDRPTPEIDDDSQSSPQPAAGPESATPLDADKLIGLLGSQVTPRTRQAVAEAPAPLKAALVLGSPDFMNR